MPKSSRGSSSPLFPGKHPLGKALESLAGLGKVFPAFFGVVWAREKRAGLGVGLSTFCGSSWWQPGTPGLSHWDLGSHLPARLLVFGSILRPSRFPENPAQPGGGRVTGPAKNGFFWGGKKCPYWYSRSSQLHSSPVAGHLIWISRASLGMQHMEQHPWAPHTRQGGGTWALGTIWWQERAGGAWESSRRGEFWDGATSLQEPGANVPRGAAPACAGDMEHLIYRDISSAGTGGSSCYLYKQN